MIVVPVCNSPVLCAIYDAGGAIMTERTPLRSSLSVASVDSLCAPIVAGDNSTPFQPACCLFIARGKSFRKAGPLFFEARSAPVSGLKSSIENPWVCDIVTDEVLAGKRESRCPTMRKVTRRSAPLRALRSWARAFARGWMECPFAVRVRQNDSCRR